jgi:hypothetical protein
MALCVTHNISFDPQWEWCIYCGKPKTAELVVVENTSTNTASFQLPLTMESCIAHLRAMWGDIHITAEVRCAVEETHDYIERQLQTLL